MARVLRIPDPVGWIDNRLRRYYFQKAVQSGSIRLSNNGDEWDRVAQAIIGHDSNSVMNIDQFAQQADLYTRSPWVYLSVGKLMNAEAPVELSVYQTIGEDIKPLKNHPIEALMRTPNTYQSRTEFFESLYAWREIAGNAYIYLAGSGSQPEQMHILRPDRVRIVPGQNTGKLVKAYVYDIDGIQIPLDASEVIHFKLFNPRNDFYGMTRLQCLQWSISTDQAMAQWNLGFFKEDRATPAGIVSIPKTMSDYDYQRVVSDWKKNYGGTNRKTAFIRGSDITYEMTGISQKDMDYGAGRQFEKELILLVYEIPPGMLDKNATEANAQAGVEVFLRGPVWSALTSVADKLTSELTPFWGTGLIIKPEDIRIVDAAAERLDIQAAGSYLTINEIRKDYYDKEPIDGGDIPANGSLAVIDTGQPVGKFDSVPTPAMEGQKPSTPAKPSASDSGSNVKTYFVKDSTLYTTEVRSEIAQFVRFANKRLGDSEAIDAFTFNNIPIATELAVKSWAEISKDSYDLSLLSERKSLLVKAIRPSAKRVSAKGIVDPYAKQRTASERELKNVVNNYLTDLQSRIIDTLKHLNKLAKAAPINFDESDTNGAFNDSWWSNEQANLEAAIQVYITQDFETAAKLKADSLYLETGVSFDQAIFNEYAAKYAKNWTDTILADFGSTNQKGTGALISKWIAAQDVSFADLIQAVQESNIFSLARAEMVAVTEVTRAFAQGEDRSIRAFANAGDYEVMYSQSQLANLLPAHPRCRCWIVTSFVYDINNVIIGIDAIWNTAADDIVCAICGPYNGRMISELV